MVVSNQKKPSRGFAKTMEYVSFTTPSNAT